MHWTKCLTIMACVASALALVAPNVPVGPGDSMVFVFLAGSLVLAVLVAALLRAGQAPVCRLNLPPGPPPASPAVRKAA